MIHMHLMLLVSVLLVKCLSLKLNMRFAFEKMKFYLIEMSDFILS